MIIDGYTVELLRDDNVKDTVTGTAAAKMYNATAMQGWVCPVCGSGVSPYVSVCPCKGVEGLDITWQPWQPGKDESNELHE